MAKQVVVCPDGRVGLLDLDDSARGDPATDIGNFLAHAIAKAGSVSGACETRRRLLEGYARLADPPDPERVARATAAALLELAHHPFRTRRPDWTRQVDERVHQAEQVLGIASGGPRCIDPTGSRDDPAFDFAGGALDPAVGSHAADRLALPPPARTEVRRHRSGRRLVLAYRGDDADADPLLVGKVRARGTHRRLAGVLDGLGAAGFGPGGGRSFAVVPVAARVDSCHLALFRFAPGTGLDREVLREGPETLIARGVFERIADGLAELQRDGPDPERTHGAREEALALAKQLRPLAAVRPEAAQSLERAAAAALDAMTPRPQRPAHRDLHPAQILLGAGRSMTWLDWDLYACADPLLDPGNLLAHLIELGLRCGRNLEPAADALRHAYLARTGHAALDLERWTALALARLVGISRRMPARHAATDTILAEALRRLEHCAAVESGALQPSGTASSAGSSRSSIRSASDSQPGSRSR